MPTDYDSTARALALDVSPPLSPTVSRPPLQTSWHRSTSSNSAGRRHSAYGYGSQSFRDKAIDAANQLRRRAKSIVDRMSLLQRVAAALVVLVSLVLTILFFVYNEKIFALLEPIAVDWKNLRAGWLICWTLTFVTAFPPVIGYSTSVTLAGFVYGFPVGWFIVASANIAGSLCAFLASRTLLSGFVHRLLAKDSRFAALSLVLKHDGLKLLIMIRLCPLPYSLSNGAMSTFPTVRPLVFALATAIASPKLMIHVFIGDRLADIARSRDKMDPTTKAINYGSIVGGIIFGIVTGYLIYQRTVARSEELEAQERSRIGQRARGLSHPDEFSDDLGAYEEQLGAGDDDIDFLEAEVDDGQYRDDSDEEGDHGYTYGGVSGENSIGMDKQQPRR
ncbi:Tlg2-vesicle protein [Trapelia coarctata]|nr:Tlg2-vesicle protein [Trapelia coarctata]